jgi:hypothetical protein
MQILNNIFQKKYQSLLFIIPILYFSIGAYFRYVLGDLSLRSLDPDYIYFITGFGISEGHFNVAHVDNPGTPLQYLMGIVYRITFLFRPGNIDFMEDVFRNPDLYMAVSNMVITGIITALLFYSGQRIYRKTGSVLYGLLIQCTPFLPVIWFDIIGRIVPELLMPIPVILIEMFLMELVHSDEETDSTKQVIFLSAVSAFGLSIKLTFLPLWFIPLLILKTWQNKLKFLALAIVFFLAFAIPVTLRLNIFTGWIKTLFIHSGQYGGGEANFVNWSEFGANLQFLWGYERWFLVTFLITFILAIAYFLTFRRKSDKKLLLVTGAVLLTIILQTGMVCKHFEHRYYIPVLLMLPLLVFLISETIKKLLRNRMQILVSAGLIFFLVAFFAHQRPWMKMKSEVMTTNMAQLTETWHFVSTLDPNAIRIITTKNYGSPFKEYALMISYSWAGSQQKYFNETLAKLYPDSYMFFTWDNTIRFWGNKLTLKKVTESKKPIYLYLENDAPELYQKTLEKFEFTKDSCSVDSTLLFKNKNTKELIYRLNFYTRNVEAIKTK